MKFWLWLVAFAMMTTARAAEPNAAALREVVDAMADLDAVYVSVLGKKAPLPELETALAAGKAKLEAAAATTGIQPPLADQIRAFAGVLDRTIGYMTRDQAKEEQKFFRAADDLAELTRLARIMGKSVAQPIHLSSAERRSLAAHVESRFGKRVPEFPRGDTSPFASDSRSPFASAVWVVSLAFDDAVNRGTPVAK